VFGKILKLTEPFLEDALLLVTEAWLVSDIVRLLRCFKDGFRGGSGPETLCWLVGSLNRERDERDIGGGLWPSLVAGLPLPRGGTGGVDVLGNVKAGSNSSGSSHIEAEVEYGDKALLL